MPSKEAFDLWFPEKGIVSARPQAVLALSRATFDDEGHVARVLMPFRFGFHLVWVTGFGSTPDEVMFDWAEAAEAAYSDAMLRDAVEVSGQNG